MAQSSESPPPLPISTGQGTQLPSRTPETTRIRRNTACVRCRDAKVKCNASFTPNQPCLRCSKLELACVVDKSHKRTSRRSKLEELAAEVQTIKDAVGPRPVLNVATTAGLPSIQPLLQTGPQLTPRLQGEPFLSSAQVAVFDRASQFTTPTDNSTSTPTRTSDVASGGPSGHNAQPRALGSRVISGEDIGYYFEKYFEHFHPYLPIVRNRDPDDCYKRGPVLFWVMIMTACRRFAKDSTIFEFLKDSLLPEIWSSVSQPSLRLPVINALLLLAAWPNPNIRFVSDPSLIFAGLSMNASFITGLHTGKGSHAEFRNLLDECDTTDEEATFTWAGCVIISHRVSAYMGLPSTNSLFNKTIEKLLDGSGVFSLPRYLTLHLETARFANKLSNTMCASLEEAHGVSHHLVAHMEEEYSKIQRLLYPENSDLDHFIILSTLLEIQIYYFMPLPNHSEDILKRNMLKCYTTAEALITTANRLQGQFALLLYAPHFVFRTLLSSACVIMTLHLSSYYSAGELTTASSPPARIVLPQGQSRHQNPDALVRKTFRIMRVCSVLDGDLVDRVTNMLEKYWELRTSFPPQHQMASIWTNPLFYSPEYGGAAGVGGVTSPAFTHRLGASMTFGCLRRWKWDVEQAMEHASSLNTMTMTTATNSNSFAADRNSAVALPAQGSDQMRAHGQEQGQGQQSRGVEGSIGGSSQQMNDPNAELGLADPFQQFDWSAFMDDFDWSFTSNYLGAS